MKRTITIVLTLLSFVVVPSAFGTQYYVRIGGNNNCNGTTDSDGASGNCAKRTIQAAINVATSAGDIVDIHTGNYTVEGRIMSASNGANGNLITIRGYTGETVSVQNIGLDNNYNHFSNMTIAGISDGAEDAGALINGNYNTVSAMIVNGRNDVEGVYGVVLSGQYNTVTANTFEGHFFIIFPMNGPNNTISNNTIKNISDVERIWDAVYNPNSISDNTVVSGNEVYSYTSPGTWNNHPDFFQVMQDVGTGTAHNWIIENNYFHDCQSSIGISENADDATGWIFRNNVFANIRDYMSILGPNAKVQNNTFFQTADPAGGGTHVLDVGWDGTEISNNIIIGYSTNTSHGMLNVVGNPLRTLQNNFYSLPRASGYTARNSTAFDLIKGTGSINGGDPLFVAAYDNCVANICDFNLQPGSILIDNGVTIAGFSSDRIGTSRPQGVAWDIGAYEYFSGQDTTPAAFSFTDNTGVALSTVIYSTSVQVTAIDNTTTLTLTGTGCEYKINAGSWVPGNDNVSLNDNVALRTTSSGSYNTPVSCTLNLGGVTDTWYATTLAAVDDPQTPRFRGSSMTGGWR